MKNKLLLFLAFFFIQNIIIQAQNDEVLPRGLSPEEQLELLNNSYSTSPNGPTFADPPPGDVRTMAEWEELQAIVVSWTGSSPMKNILKQIVDHARKEVEVLIVCSSSAVATNQLLSGPFSLSDLDNITFVVTQFNSIWVRDYGPNTVYLNDVEEQFMIDWIYNRPRPQDDTVVPGAVADELNIPLYETTDCSAGLDLVHTGGNFMNDGMGTAFSSRLILDENGFTNQYGCSNHSESEMISIMNTFMGIQDYVLMENLIYDPIDHIDMHMKLLDEETLLVGEYPEGKADGPQIEANLQYVLSNFQTPYERPYNVIRIPMPPEVRPDTTTGSTIVFDYYPDDVFQDPMPGNEKPDYRTYANAVIVNKTILVPTYEEQFDTVGLKIWEEAMPGYKIQGIDCNGIIDLNGAIHCITKEVGVSEPCLLYTSDAADE